MIERGTYPCMVEITSRSFSTWQRGSARSGRPFVLTWGLATASSVLFRGEHWIVEHERKLSQSVPRESRSHWFVHELCKSIVLVPVVATYCSRGTALTWCVGRTQCLSSVNVGMQEEGAG